MASNSPTTTPPPVNVPATPIESGYKYILAYGVLITTLILISKFRVGYNAIYYTLLLALLLVLVTESKFIVSALSPINAYAPDGTAVPLPGAVH